MLVLSKGAAGPADELLHFSGEAVPQGHHAVHQLGQHHGQQGVYHQNADDQTGEHRRRVGKALELFRKMHLEKGFQSVTQGPQQISHHAAVDKGGQDGAELPQQLSHTLKPVQQEEQQNTQADGAETGHHAIEIPLLSGINHMHQLVSWSLRLVYQPKGRDK